MSLFLSAATASECAALFPTSIEAARTIAKHAKERAVKSLEGIFESPATTFSPTCFLVDRASAELSMAGSILSVLKNVHPNKDMRDEASSLIVDLDAFGIDNFSSNKRLFNVLKGIDTSQEPKLANECPYWLQEELSGYRRRGMELDGPSFDNVVRLQKEISALCTEFSTNIAEDKSEFMVSKEDLLGVPQSVVNNLKKTDDDRFTLRMDYPTYFGVMKNCEVAKTRRVMAETFENRAFPKNQAVLQEIIFKRRELAATLGYASYSHYDLESKMSRHPDVANKFISDLVPGLLEKWREEIEVIKRHLHSSVTLSEDGKIPSWDLPFCMNQVKQQQLNVSETTIQEYFPLESTVKALFDIYESFFGITFEKFENGSELWNANTSTLAVREKEDGELLGHIILDLFPRDGKFSHACCHSVVPPVWQDNGKFSPALSVVLANFPSATSDTPALFLHDDVETFFHEFGHAIHGLMGRSRMTTFAGTRVKRDFVELPSQMLEEWLWEPSILSRVTSHYKTGETLPKPLIDAKVASKNAFSGRDSLRQLQFATYALSIFGTPFSTAAPAPSDYDTTALFQTIQPALLPGVQFSEDSHFECAFGHLTGYGATYYGYMWSEVFAQDVFQYIKDHDGLLSPVLGKRYRDLIIGVGGGRDPNDMLRDFLEREPNSVAFLAKLGVAV